VRACKRAGYGIDRLSGFRYRESLPSVKISSLTPTLFSKLKIESRLILNRQGEPATLTLMFGSSGLITYSTGRLLRMWDQAL
jgi:hypothetical protein